MTKNDWMSDDRLKVISQRKLLFLSDLFFEFQELKENERLPFLLALATKAAKENISFSKEEVLIISDVLKESSDDEEIKKMNQMLSIFYKKS